MKKTIAKYSQQIILACIIAVAFFLRMYHLGYQSLWLDELGTFNECDPAHGWKELFNNLLCCDQHPPLFFVIERIFLQLFGTSETIVRLPSVIAGTMGVLAIYLLGREFYNRRLGLIAAALTSINFFNLLYSQEARPYAFVTLFVILSFFYFIRFIKTQKRKDCIFYAAFSLLMIYSNYFALFILASQITIGFIFLLFEDNKKQFLKNSIIGILIIAIGFLPLFYFLKWVTAIKSFWIPETPQSFAIDYFYEYFGNSDLLKPFLLLLLISYLVHSFIGISKETGKVKEKPLTFAFLICSLWIFIGFFIPYIRSILVIPMLVPRYTISMLPAFIILLSFGIEMIASQAIKYTILAFFILISSTNIFLLKRYYSTISKTQFREVVRFVAANQSFRYPIVTDITAWYQTYYLNKFNYHVDMLTGKKENTIDSIIYKSSKRYDLEGFWIVGAHGEQKMQKEIYSHIDSSYILLEERHFLDAWAQLYVARSINAGNTTVINYKYFPTEQTFILNNDTVTAIWSKDAVSHPVAIKKGVYKIIVIATGTPVADIYPHVLFSINDKLLNSYFLSSNNEEKTFEFEVKEDTTATFKIVMDNDACNTIMKEDRNVFINSIIIIPH